LAKIYTKFTKRTQDAEGEEAMLRKMLHLDFKKAPTEFAWRAKKRYFGNEDIGPETTKQLGNMLTDEQIKFVVWKAATLFQKNCKNNNVFHYKYGHKGTYGMWMVWGLEDEGYGPSHFDDCLVMFKNKVKSITSCASKMLGIFFHFQFFPIPEDAEGDKLASRNFWHLWSNFALSGQPHEHWKPLSEQDSYMSIGTTLEVKQGIDEGNFQFWNEMSSRQLSRSKL
jgi:hypothetical protein